jgi:competence protein ComEC
MKLGAWKFVFLSLILAASAIWIGVSKTPDDKLHIIACDVGQGDGILITYQATQILIDGGPDSKILDCLGKYMPFWDKTIEAVILTHPQLDHYGGLIDVVRRYSVENFVANALDSDAKAYLELKREVAERAIKVTNPNENTEIRYGLLYLDIVHPSQKFLTDNSSFNGTGTKGNILGSYTSTVDPNEFSVVAILSFGDFDAVFTGDLIPDAAREVLVEGGLRDVEYIKVPHHGSKNGLTLELLEAVSPEIAAISSGRNNRYGHPHQEILKMLEDEGIRTLRTDESGDIEIITDGKAWQTRN